MQLDNPTIRKIQHSLGKLIRFTTERDPYRMIAAEFFNVPVADVTEEQIAYIKRQAYTDTYPKSE